MGIRFLEMSPERTVATMPVEGNTQVAGILHGGAHVVLAETLGSFAAGMHAGPGRQALGIEVSATHHRSISGRHGDRNLYGHPPRPDADHARNRDDG
jgi:1,4-dihydroxy-2-naphthoyl-CoA hydrolase